MELQFERYCVVGDKVGERKEVMGTKTCGSGLNSASERAHDEILNYIKKSAYAQGLVIFQFFSFFHLGIVGHCLWCIY